MTTAAPATPAPLLLDEHYGFTAVRLFTSSGDTPTLARAGAALRSRGFLTTTMPDEYNAGPTGFVNPSASAAGFWVQEVGGAFELQTLLRGLGFTVLIDRITSREVGEPEDLYSETGQE